MTAFISVNDEEHFSSGLIRTEVFPLLAEFEKLPKTTIKKILNHQQENNRDPQDSNVNPKCRIPFNWVEYQGQQITSILSRIKKRKRNTFVSNNDDNDFISSNNNNNNNNSSSNNNNNNNNSNNNNNNSNNNSNNNNNNNTIKSNIEKKDESDQKKEISNDEEIKDTQSPTGKSKNVSVSFAESIFTNSLLKNHDHMSNNEMYVTACRSRNTSSSISEEIGIDESGRGSLCGPVVVAAVVLPDDIEKDENFLSCLNDSKTISENMRTIIAIEIQKRALSWTVQYSSVRQIDETNILEANMNACHRCLSEILIKKNLRHPSGPVTCAAMDGNYWTPSDLYGKLTVTPETKGDSRFRNIAAASILAKVYRDLWILKFSSCNEEIANKYDLIKNKGYGTPKHLAALKEYGPVRGLHRLTFSPCSSLQA